MNAKTLIEQLKLTPHPEGGYYRETYRSQQKIETDKHYIRNAGTVIYFLLENNQKSHFHRIQSDETWFFHQGEALEIVAIIEGKLNTFVLGNNMEQNEFPQITIPAQTWFAAKINHSKGYALVSCSVAPGFEFSDFELAKRDILLQTFPDLKNVIIEFTS